MGQLNIYLDVLRRRKWVVLAPLLFGLVGAAAVTFWMPRVYSASATARIALAGQEAGGPLDPAQAERLTNTYVQIVQSRPLLSNVITELGLETSPEALLGRIHVEPIVGTELIRIRAEAAVPEEARDLANALAYALVEEGRTFYADSASPSLADAFGVEELAVLPTSPVRPNLPLAVATGSLVGLAAGAGLALVFEYVDPKLRRVKELAEITPLPVLSSLSRSRKSLTNGGNPRLEAGAQPVFTVSGGERALAMNLLGLLVEQQVRSILVTSPRPDQGTTSVAVSTGVALARSGVEVMLVDANLHNPFLHRVFGLSNLTGLRNILHTIPSTPDDPQALVAGAAQASQVPGLHVLTSGLPVGEPSELLASDGMRTLVKLFSERPHVTVIDAPPVLRSEDAAALAPLVGGVVMVCAEGEATADSVREALNHLQSARANVLGLVYNKAQYG
jgi:capsular exopolysaccharide synthesis family protein